MPRTSMRDGRYTKRYKFKYSILQEAASATALGASQTKTATPTHTLTTKVPDTLKSGTVLRIHYRIKSSNSSTYTLRIWADAIAANYESNLNMLYESPSLQASDTDYDREVEIPFILGAEGSFYYSLEWSAASGDHQGFIEASGDEGEESQ